jgi:hypothetical protein
VGAARDLAVLPQVVGDGPIQLERHAIPLAVVGEILLVARTRGLVLPVRHASSVVIAHHLPGRRRPTVLRADDRVADHVAAEVIAGLIDGGTGSGRVADAADPMQVATGVAVAACRGAAEPVEGVVAEALLVIRRSEIPRRDRATGRCAVVARPGQTVEAVVAVDRVICAIRQAQVLGRHVAHRVIRAVLAPQGRVVEGVYERAARLPSVAVYTLAASSQRAGEVQLKHSTLGNRVALG